MWLFLSCVASEQAEVPGVFQKEISEQVSICNLTTFWLPAGNEGRKITVDLMYGDTNIAYILVDIISENRVVRGYECSMGGIQSFFLPNDASSAWIMAYADLDQDGPSKIDPQGRSTIITNQSDYKIAILPGFVVEEAFHLDMPRAP